MANTSATRAWSWDSALQGIVPPMISPLTPKGAVDGPSLAMVVAHILDGGCSGLFVLGGCGEGAWLTPSQRAAVIQGTVAAAAGRVPVLAGIMLPATGPAVEAARWAADAGADALVIGSPYYLGVNGAAQTRHVEAILAAVPLPVLLYNIPQCTHNVLAPATVRALAGEPRILGIKDSAGDFEAFQFFVGVKKVRPDFRVLQGHEAYAAASLLQGGDGLVPGMSNYVPALFVALRRAAAVHDLKACVELQEQITALGVLHTHGHWLPALKAACEFLGLGNGIPSPPLVRAAEEERRQIRAILIAQGVLSA
jgi:dihydrodipicolinate synthase/N-acetylneuraminate lyase